jgi:hypothetical protein
MVDVPRMSLKDLTWKNIARFNELMEKHSFIVLTDLGAVGDEYLRLREVMQQFFKEDATTKQACTSTYIYQNENKTPMWYAGYEHTHVRECFRVHCGDMSRMLWPNATFEASWRSLVIILGFYVLDEQMNAHMTCM